MVSVDVKHHVYLLGHKTQTKIHVFRFGQRVCVEKHALQAETLCFALDGGSVYQRAHYCKLKTLYSLLGEGHYCKLKTLYSLLGEGHYCKLKTLYSLLGDGHYCKLKTLYSLLGEGHYCKLKTLYYLLGEGLCWSVTQAENPVFCNG